MYRIWTYLDKDNITNTENWRNKAKSAKTNFKESLSTFGDKKVINAFKEVEKKLKKVARDKSKQNFLELMHLDVREIITSKTKGRKRKRSSLTSPNNKTIKKKLKLSPKIPPDPEKKLPNRFKKINKKQGPPVSKNDTSTPPTLSNILKKKSQSNPYKNLFKNAQRTTNSIPSRRPKVIIKKSISKTPLRRFTKMTTKKSLPTNTTSAAIASKHYPKTANSPRSQISTKPAPYPVSRKALTTPTSSTTITQKPTFSSQINPNNNNIIVNKVQIMNPINAPFPNYKNNIQNSKLRKTPIISKVKSLQQNLASPVFSNSPNLSKPKIQFKGEKLYSNLIFQPNHKTQPSLFSNLCKEIENILPELKCNATISYTTPNNFASKTQRNSTTQTPNLLPSKNVISDELQPIHSQNQSNYPSTQTSQNPSNKNEFSPNLNSIFDKPAIKLPVKSNQNQQNSFTFPQQMKSTRPESKLHVMQRSQQITNLIKSMKKTMLNQKHTISKKDKKISQLSKQVEKLQQVSIKKVKLTTARACKAIEISINNDKINIAGRDALKRLFVTITKSNLFKVQKFNEVETDGRLLSVGARGGSKLWLEITNRNKKNLNNESCSDETIRKLENELLKIIKFLGLNKKNLIKILKKHFDTRVDGPINFPSHKLFKVWATLPLSSKKLLRRFINLVRKEEPQINLGSINCLATYEKELTLQSAVSEELNFLIKVPTKKNGLKINVYEDCPYYHADALEVVPQIINLGHKYNHIIHHQMLPANQMTFTIKSDKFGGGTETIISCINKKNPNSAQTSVILEYFKAPDKIPNMEITLKKNNKENMTNLFYHTSILTLLIPTDPEKEPQKISVLLINDDKDSKNLELKEWVFKSMLFFNNKDVDIEFPNGFFTTHLFM